MIVLVSSYLRSDIDVKKRITEIDHASQTLIHCIETKQEQLTELLLTYESFETVKDEIVRSIDCLRNLNKEHDFLSKGFVDLMCVFFPINLPLYSLILYGIVPGFMSKELIARPPLLMRNLMKQICELLEINTVFPHVRFVDVDRSVYLEAFVSVADVVVFTGRYENAKDVEAACPQALFIYSGYGVNPIVITDSADLKESVAKTIEARIFNSGQDCHGSDIIFVHERVLSDFKSELIASLAEIRIGEDYHNRDVRIGPLLKSEQSATVQAFFDQHKNTIVYGGTVDEHHTVFPTVIVETLKDLSNFTPFEFFSPVFYILVYTNETELQQYFLAPRYRDVAMYASVFSKHPLTFEIPNTVVLQNKILNDVERGNEPFGGYGPKANYSKYKGTYHYRPILISSEIHQFLVGEL